MAKENIVNLKGEKVSDITLNEKVWNIKPNDAVIYDAIVLTRASQRQGTANTKTRSEVSGGGRKPWRQKGTGHARQGSTRAPHWYHGGVVFGPHPRTYNKKMNKKERMLALKSALSYKVLDKNLIVVDDLTLKTNKTKDMIKILEGLKVSKNILIVVKELSDNLILATRNIPKVELLTYDELNALEVIAADYMIITKDAVKSVEEVLS
ncbi:MAG: 50S ribosomal protein L4 [Bacilli bacterium]|nr:50S ribosomal protein L4 [Bacilli bacterium]